MGLSAHSPASVVSLHLLRSASLPFCSRLCRPLAPLHSLSFCPPALPLRRYIAVILLFLDCHLRFVATTAASVFFLFTFCFSLF